MSRPRIGVDLDGVVYDWQGAYTYLVNRHRGANLSTDLEWWDDWHAPDRYLTDDDLAWVWGEGVDLGLFRYGHVLKGAIDGLRDLAELGDVEVVTHRPREALRDTLYFVAGLPDVLSGVHFLTRAEPKSSVGCDVYVDDAPHVALELWTEARPCVLFDQPWNRHLPAADDRSLITRAYGWAQVPDLVTTALDEWSRP